MAAPIALHPTAALSERVLLPGDPGRALMLAESLLEGARMFNHNRGLWGYTGRAPDGEPLTIQSTGIGGPSAAIVIHELVDLGARRLLRTGTCGALQSGLALGDLVIATEAIAADGASRALGAGGRVPASPTLVDAVIAAADPLLPDHSHSIHSGPVVTTDLFYDDRGLEREWSEAGALAVEMEAATLFALAAARGVEAAAVLVVSDLVLPERARIDSGDLRTAEVWMGEAALRTLCAETSASPEAAASGLRSSSVRERGLEPRECLLDRDQTFVQRAPRSELLDPQVEPVEAVLNRLEPLGDAPQPSRQPLEIAGRGQVQRAHRDLLGAGGALAGLECGRQRLAHDGILEHSLRDPADRFLALARDPIAEAFVLVAHAHQPLVIDPNLITALS